MTLATLRSEVQANIADTTSATQTRIATWLNWTVLHMAQRYDWLDLVSLNTTSYDTAASTETVALASTVKKIYNIRYVDTSGTVKSRVLKYRPAYFQNALRPYPAGDATNTPVYYWVVGRTLYLSPIPDSAKDLYITLHSWPTDMSSNSDTPSINNVDEAIVAGATYRAYRALPQLDGADFIKEWRDEYYRLTLEANLLDKQLAGWRAYLRPHNAVGSRVHVSTNPSADPLIRQWN